MTIKEALLKDVFVLSLHVQTYSTRARIGMASSGETDDAPHNIERLRCLCRRSFKVVPAEGGIPDKQPLRTCSLTFSIAFRVGPDNFPFHLKSNCSRLLSMHSGSGVGNILSSSTSPSFRNTSPTSLENLWLSTVPLRRVLMIL